MAPRLPSHPSAKGAKSGANLKRAKRNKIRRGPKTATKAKPETLGWRLQRTRKAHDLTQAELARRIGVGQGAVSAWERGTVQEEDIPANKIKLLSLELGVSEAYLRNGKESASMAGEDRSPRIKLPAPQNGTEVLGVALRGLTEESLTLAQAQKALREAVKAGKPVWVVVG